MYIAIEGLKGVGKSTLLDALCERLNAENVRFSLLAPTRPLASESWVEAIAKRGAFLRKYDVFCRYLYRYRSNQHARLTDWSQPLILGDRSIFTSLVTRWPTNNSHTQTAYIKKTKAQEHVIAWPDEMIYLEMPLNELLVRLQNRCRDYGQHDECLERLIMAQQAYYQLQYQKSGLDVLSQVRWRNINANQPANVLLEEVYALIKSRCPQAWPNGV